METENRTTTQSDPSMFSDSVSYWVLGTRFLSDSSIMLLFSITNSSIFSMSYFPGANSSIISNWFCPCEGLTKLQVGSSTAVGVEERIKMNFEWNEITNSAWCVIITLLTWTHVSGRSQCLKYWLDFDDKQLQRCLRMVVQSAPLKLTCLQSYKTYRKCCVLKHCGQS